MNVLLIRSLAGIGEVLCCESILDKDFQIEMMLFLKTPASVFSLICSSVLIFISRPVSGCMFPLWTCWYEL